MSSPVTPDEVKGTLAAASKTVCQKLSGLIEFFSEYRKVHSYFFTDTGTFSDNFSADLCRLACVRGLTPTGSCLPITLHATVTTRNTRVDLHFDGDNMLDGTSYSIYRKTTEGSEWGTAVKTGTSAGSTVDYTDTDVTNDVTYYYKCEVQDNAHNCNDSYDIAVTATPTLCSKFPLAVALSVPGAGIVRIQLSGIPDWIVSPTVEFYRSESPLQMGSLITPDSIGNYAYNDSAAPVLHHFYYTVLVKESEGCDAVIASANINTTAGDLTKPVISILGRTLTIQRIPSAQMFQVSAYRHTTCGASKNAGPPDGTSAWQDRLGWQNQAATGDTNIVLDPDAFTETVEGGWCYSLSVKASSIDFLHQSEWSETVQWKQGACA